MFFGRDEAEFFPGVEVMVDAGIVLIAINLISVSVGQVESILPAHEGNEPGIQTIGIQGRVSCSSGEELVWRRHAPQLLLYERRIGNSRPESRRISIWPAVGDGRALVGAVTE